MVIDKINNFNKQKYCNPMSQYKYRAYCYDKFYELNERNEYDAKWVMVEVLTLHIAKQSLRGRYFKNGKPVVNNYKQKDIQAIMRYSGKKDKNGKEVWEGDIIKNGDNYYIIKFGWSVEGDDVDLVAFIGFYLEPINNDLCEESLIDRSGYVRGYVIGNIYEHSHLIK